MFELETLYCNWLYVADIFPMALHMINTFLMKFIQDYD